RTRRRPAGGDAELRADGVGRRAGSPFAPLPDSGDPRRTRALLRLESGEVDPVRYRSPGIVTTIPDQLVVARAHRPVLQGANSSTFDGKDADHDRLGL